MKRCANCKKEKSLDEFCSDKPKKDGKSSYCNKCRREIDARNSAKPERKAWIKAKNQRILTKNKQNIVEYLKTHSCIDCGEQDIIVLDFDHQGNKTMNVSKMLYTFYSWKRILEEINKCVVRCANCHRRKTFNYVTYYRRGAV